MCCLFGLIDPNHAFSGREKARIMHILATASEARGIDATGYALNHGGKLRIYKRPVPGHKLQFHIRDNTNVVMGHTRMTTQGDAVRNENNHPFAGQSGGKAFALAHNGVIWNDAELRGWLNLPETKIETDSYVAVQLLESQKSLDFESLKYMAEQIQGTFTFTALTAADELYFVRGDNPMCLVWFEDCGLFLYASTVEIMDDALRRMPFLKGNPAYLPIRCGEIWMVDHSGNITCGEFDARCLWSDFYECVPMTEDKDKAYNAEYIAELKCIAESEGYDSRIVDYLIERGYTLWDIEAVIYDAYYEVEYNGCERGNHDVCAGKTVAWAWH